MTVEAMCEQMSAHELTTQWPAFFRARRKWQEAEEAKK